MYCLPKTLNKPSLYFIPVVLLFILKVKSKLQWLNMAVLNLVWRIFQTENGLIFDNSDISSNIMNFKI